MKLRYLTLSFIALLTWPVVAQAHEAYVLTKEQLARGLAAPFVNPFTTLANPANLKISLLVVFGSLIVFAFSFVFAHSSVGRLFDEKMNKLEPFGHVLLRLALAAALIASGLTATFLDPAIPLSSIAGLAVAPSLLFIVGGLILFGLFTEIAGLIGLLLLILATIVYGGYMLTYINYYGQFIALIFFGSHFFSLDKLLKKPAAWAEKYRDVKLAIIRVTYGLALLYPAISIKLLHPQVIVDIVNIYHLNQFHWLFPNDQLLISLGAGLTQIVLGLFIIIGFQTRLSSLATFIFMTLSVLFFKEAVWPHYILLALALYLMINNGGRLGLDYVRGRSPFAKKH